MKKNILVTGSSRGIGESLIREFAKNNYDVIINYRKNKEKALKLQNDIISQYKVKCLCVKADISKERDVQKMLDKIIKKFGKLDILINNAGISMDNYLEDKTKHEFMKVLEVNAGGTFVTSKYASKYVNEIINISSTDADDTYNDVSIDYCASKAAINSMTKTFALALPNKRVIAIMLPWVNTDPIKEMDQEFLKQELIRTNQNTLYEPEEIAKQIFKIYNDSNIKTGSIVRL